MRIAAGQYNVEIEGGADGIEIRDSTVTLRRGGHELVKIVEQRASPVSPTDQLGDASPPPGLTTADRLQLLNQLKQLNQQNVKPSDSLLRKLFLPTHDGETSLQSRIKAYERAWRLQSEVPALRNMGFDDELIRSLLRDPAKIERASEILRKLRNSSDDGSKRKTGKTDGKSASPTAEDAIPRDVVYRDWVSRDVVERLLRDLLQGERGNESLWLDRVLLEDPEATKKLKESILRGQGNSSEEEQFPQQESSSFLKKALQNLGEPDLSPSDIAQINALRQVRDELNQRDRQHRNTPAAPLDFLKSPEDAPKSQTPLETLRKPQSTGKLLFTCSVEIPRTASRDTVLLIYEDGTVTVPDRKVSEKLSDAELKKLLKLFAEAHRSLGFRREQSEEERDQYRAAVKEINPQSYMQVSVMTEAGYYGIYHPHQFGKRKGDRPWPEGFEQFRRLNDCIDKISQQLRGGELKQEPATTGKLDAEALLRMIDMVTGQERKKLDAETLRDNILKAAGLIIPGEKIPPASIVSAKNKG